MTENDSHDEELFSMDELEQDLKRTRGARRLPWLVAGLVLGVVGTLLVPRYVGPYLSFGGGELLTGPVLAEEREEDRLLLTIDAAQGAFIASFSERVSEIGLLVEPGDTVTISVPDYDPFVEDPDFEGVKKRRAPGDPREARVDSAPTEAVPRESDPDTAPPVEGAEPDTVREVAEPAGGPADTVAAPDTASGGSRPLL